jgi:ribosome recycling factor
MDHPITSELKQKMAKSLAVIHEDLATIRTGRATPALVENVIVLTYEGTQNLRLRELATISTEGPKMIIIAPYDPSTTRDIERGIGAANLGYTGSVDGNIIRIVLPALTAERREEYIKLAHQKIESGRVMMRQNRHEMMNQIKKKMEDSEIGEDEKKRLEKEIQDVTDEMMAELDGLKERKEKELREI